MNSPGLILALVLIVVHLTLPVAGWMLVARQRSHAANLWFAGGVVYSLGVVLMMLRTAAPPWIGYLGPALFLFASHQFLIDAVRIELGRSRWPLAAHALLLLGWMAVYGWIYTSGRTVELGAASHSIAFIALQGYLVVLLRRLRMRTGSLALTLISGSILMSIAAHVLRLGLLGLTPWRYSVERMDAISGAMTLVFVVAFLVIYAGWLGYSLERIRVAEAAARERQQKAELEVRQRDQLLLSNARFATLSGLATYSSSIVHEISQPLQTIGLALEALNTKTMGRPDAAQLREDLDEALETVERAREIVRTLRSMMAPGGSLHSEFRLRDALDAIRPVIVSEARRRNIEFTFENRFDDARVRGSEVMLQRIVFNLAGNAFDELAEVPAPHRLAITVSRGDSNDEPGVVLSVEDSGRGLSAEARGIIAKPFATGKPSGMGMGLLMTDSLVRQWGGTLRFVDAAAGEPRPGTRVEIRLPCASGDAPKHDEPSAGVRPT